MILVSMLKAKKQVMSCRTTKNVPEVSNSILLGVSNPAWKPRDVNQEDQIVDWRFI